MGRESGAAVVIDCHNGDILAFVSMPSFDPNSFSDGISTSEYAWLRADDHQPLINKATRGLYPPGSTPKPPAAIAAIGNRSAERRVGQECGRTCGSRAAR